MSEKPQNAKATLAENPDSPNDPAGAASRESDPGDNPSAENSQKPDSTAEISISASSATVSVDMNALAADEDGFRPETFAAVQAAAPPGYEILRVLGRGGMGVVYEARQIALKRRVALKMVTAGVHSNPAQMARFQIEAEAVASLQHNR